MRNFAAAEPSVERARGRGCWRALMMMAPSNDGFETVASLIKMMLDVNGIHVSSHCLKMTIRKPTLKLKLIFSTHSRKLFFRCEKYFRPSPHSSICVVNFETDKRQTTLNCTNGSPSTIFNSSRASLICFILVLLSFDSIAWHTAAVIYFGWQ